MDVPILRAPDRLIQLGIALEPQRALDTGPRESRADFAWQQARHDLDFHPENARQRFPRNRAPRITAARQTLDLGVPIRTMNAAEYFWRETSLGGLLLRSHA
jgi:hypothetical protein